MNHTTETHPQETSPICVECQARHVGWNKKRTDGSKIWRKKCPVCSGYAPQEQLDRYNLIANHGLHCDECGYKAADLRQLRVKKTAPGQVLCLNCAAIA